MSRQQIASVPLPNAREVRLFRSRILGWFRLQGRHFPWRQKNTSLYELILSEILLQRTRAETVAAFLAPFLARFPSWHSIAGAKEKEIAKWLKPLGLWRRRARSLLALAREMSTRKGRFPSNRVDIEALPGVGQYIANAICLFAFNQPEPLIDVNMARVLERCFGPRTLADIRYDPKLQTLSRIIVSDRHSPQVNWAIIDLAATVCTRLDPACLTCPLLRSCAHGQELTGGGSKSASRTAGIRKHALKTKGGESRLRLPLAHGFASR
jgi:A/G-specific adenine glycosylase